MNALQAFQTIYTVLEAERKMREHVFRYQPSKRRQKVGEIDRALAALEWLRAIYERDHPELFAEQPTLFGE